MFVQREGWGCEPYFNLGNTVQLRFPSHWVKMIEDCIKGPGDQGSVSKKIAKTQNPEKFEVPENLNVHLFQMLRNFHVNDLQILKK